MQYMGGKSVIAKKIAAIIGGGDILVEPFVGGAAMTTALAPVFAHVRAYDIHPDLIELLNAVKGGWLPPENVTEEEYRELRGQAPSALRGFAGFALSWGGKWFGGYARGGVKNYAAIGSRSLKKSAASFSNVTFARSDYRDITIPAGATVYCDPPYAGTTKYAGEFSSREFWGVAKGWAAQGARVFVSEQHAPEGWDILWEEDFTRKMASSKIFTAKERLYFMGDYF